MDGLSGAASGIHTPGSFGGTQLISAGMAVVSLAVQLAKGLIELYDFWGSVRDAPEEVCEMLKDLQMLSNILNELITRKDPSPHVSDALEHCYTKIEVHIPISLFHLKEQRSVLFLFLFFLLLFPFLLLLTVLVSYFEV